MAPSGPLDGSSPKRRRPWYQSANPLRWRPAPDAPTEPLVSPEYEAGFLSKLTFQWMTPLMSVRIPPFSLFLFLPHFAVRHL